MTPRELLAMVVLYRACPDDAVRRRACSLLPELGELVSEAAGIDAQAYISRRWKLSAYRECINVAGGHFREHLGHTTVVCSERDLPTHKADYAARFDLATGVTVDAERA